MEDFHADSSSNYEFSYTDFIPGETKTTNWNLRVINPQKSAKAIISFMDRRGNDTTIQINYTGVLSVNSGNDFSFSDIIIKPNPAGNEGAEISFSLGERLEINMTLFDLEGRKIRTLSESVFDTGIHSLSLDTHDLPAGQYIIKIRGQNKTAEKKLIISK